MGKRAGMAAAVSVVTMLVFVLASTAASESVTGNAKQIRAGMLAESWLELPLPQLHLRQGPDWPGREESSSTSPLYSVTDRFKLDAQAAVPDDASVTENTAAASAGIISTSLPSPTKISTAVSATCSYTVTIKTSCYSPRVTHDAISLTFSDAYGNQVYAARLDDPYSNTFERCSTDTFMVQGPCGYKTCFLYMRRSGRDGWAPDWVKVASPYTRQAVTFYYNGYTLPENVWYGFNLCSSFSSGVGTGTAGRALWMVAVVLLVLVLEPPEVFHGVHLF